MRNAWEARALLALTEFLHNYLASDPPPEESNVAHDFEEWARNLDSYEEEYRAMLASQPKSCDAWIRMLLPNRERVALECFGDDRLTIYELWARLYPEYKIGKNGVRSLVGRLFKAGELDRVTELRCPGGTATRHRYHRNTNLSGPIADLDRLFHVDA